MTSRRITSQSQVVTNGIGIQSGGTVHTTTSALPITVSGIAVAPQPVNLAEAFKPKRAGKNPNLSHIIFVLDDSASMQSCRQSTIAGYNEYLQGQKEDAKKTGIKTLVSLYKFNGWQVNNVFDRKDVAEVSPLTEKDYNPQGGTNLLDAIGGVMMQINNLLIAKEKSDRESVIITILTDGEENQSRTFDNAAIKAMVEKAEAKNWAFMFLGANIDAFHAASTMGFSVHSTMQYDTAAAENTIRAASAMTSRLKAGYASGMDTTANYMVSAFTQAERQAAVTKDDE